MPFASDAADRVDALDDDLLAALDDVLAFSESSVIDEAVSKGDTMTLEDELSTSRLIEVSPLLPAEERMEEATSPIPLDNAILSRHRPTEGPKMPSCPGKNGKDVRMVPYSTTHKLRRRKRPKDELDSLRAKVTDLEKKLAVLKRQEVGLPCAQVICAGNGSNTIESSQDMQQRWKTFAKHKKNEADRSVLENLRLRAMLEGQLTVTKSLMEVIDQQLRESTQFLPMARNGIGGSKSVVSDDFIFAHLNGSLDSQYLELDTIFEQSGINRVNCDLKIGSKVHHDGNGMSIRHEEVRVYPFPMEAVQQAIWCIFRYKAGKDMMFGPVQTQMVDENRLNITVRERIVLGEAQVMDIVRRFSFQRLFEKNRIVNVWSSYLEIDGSIFIRLRDKGYLTTSYYNCGTDNFGSDVPGSVTGSVTRIVVLVSPELTAFTSNGAQIGETTALIARLYRVCVGIILSIVDTLLLSGGQMIKCEATAE